MKDKAQWATEAHSTSEFIGVVKDGGHELVCLTFATVVWQADRLADKMWV